MKRRAFLIFLAMLAFAASGMQAQRNDSPLDKFVGQFSPAAAPEQVLSITTDGQHLFAESERYPKIELSSVSPLEFEATDGGKTIHITFSGGRRGRPDSVSVVMPGAKFMARRVSDQPKVFAFHPYERQEVMIPMRDGVRLHTVIVRPTDINTPLPILMTRTPYGTESMTPDAVSHGRPELARSGYIFVGQDIRGRYKSEGVFEMVKPLADHANPKRTDESTDAYDTVDWLIKNVAGNNGRVGISGVSYPGFLAAEASIDPHPAVKAVSPQAPMTDVWMGDDFFHNGAFRQTYGYDYVIGLESGKENSFGKLDQDAYDYFLKQGSYNAAGTSSNMAKMPTFISLVEHASYDDYWKARAVQKQLKRVTVPMLLVGGMWDQEDMWGPQAEYAALEPSDSGHENFLVLGPWNHGEWNGDARHLGDLDFGRPTGDEYRAQIEAPFFAHYLKGESGFNLEDTASFQTGTNQWKRYSHWPPVEGIAKRNLYLSANGGLSFDTPSSGGEDSFSSYISDPAAPVPYRKRPIEATYAPGGSGWPTWLAQNQQFLDGRKDILSFSTPVLDKDVTVTGDVVADLFASTSGTDSDWIVKLIDVYPDDQSLEKMSGYELMIAEEIFRGRYRESFEQPQALAANQPLEYRFSLHAADHAFLKGHRIMVQVQSSWFPLYDRNPQQFVPNIMLAKPADFQPATQRVFWSTQYPSHLELPIAK